MTDERVIIPDKLQAIRKGPTGGEAWMLTFSDLLLLLLTMFAMQISMSTFKNHTQKTGTTQMQQTGTVKNIKDFTQKLKGYHTNSAMLSPLNHSSKLQIKQNSLNVLEITLNTNPFFLDSEELNFKGKEFIQDISEVAKLKHYDLSLKLQKNSGDWDLAERQTARLVRQLIDSGVSINQISAQAILQPFTQHTPENFKQIVKICVTLRKQKNPNRPSIDQKIQSLY